MTGLNVPPASIHQYAVEAVKVQPGWRSQPLPNESLVESEQDRLTDHKLLEICMGGIQQKIVLRRYQRTGDFQRD